MKNIYLLSADREPFALNARISKILESIKIKGIPFDRIAFIHSNCGDAVHAKESFIMTIGREYEDIAIEATIPDLYFLHTTLMPDAVEVIIIIPPIELYNNVYKLFAKKDKEYEPVFKPDQIVTLLPLSKYKFEVEVL